MKIRIVRFFRHAKLIFVALYRFLRGRVSAKTLKFLHNYSLLRFIINFKEVNLFSIKTVIDGGANRGHFSQLLLRLNPTVSIHAFEPLATKEFSVSPDSCYSSMEKLKDHYCNFHYSSNALSDAESIELFNVTSFDECSSLLKPPSDANFTDSFNVIKSFDVHCITLEKFIIDNNIAEVNLLKLDLQGAELKALKGAGKMLSKFDFIFAELNLNRIYEQLASISEVVEYLHEYNFIFVDIKKVIRTADGSITQVDGLFAKKSNISIQTVSSLVH